VVTLLRVLGLTFLAALPVFCQMVDCACDPANPESMKARQCSLCAEADKHPEGTTAFFLKDINPRKPNRYLALPKVHTPKGHRLADLTADQRTALWTAAIAKAKELWGDKNWGLAINGDKVRTQCHTHIHISRLLPGVDWGDNFVEVSSPAEIPVPGEDGLWIHPSANGKLKVHRGEQVTETVLLR
jgi:diadenosine tetraphosphate (Ap4A) HIT family hydrolase